MNKRTWAHAALIRAIKTMAQTAIALIGTNTVGITEIDWLAVGSASLLAGIVSILTSIAGLPEVDSGDYSEIDEINEDEKTKG